MNDRYALQTLIEIAVFLLLVYGLRHEDKIADWERNMFRRMLRKRKLPAETPAAKSDTLSKSA